MLFAWIDLFDRALKCVEHRFNQRIVRGFLRARQIRRRQDLFRCLERSGCILQRGLAGLRNRRLLDQWFRCWLCKVRSSTAGARSG